MGRSFMHLCLGTFFQHTHTHTHSHTHSHTHTLYYIGMGRSFMHVCLAVLLLIVLVLVCTFILDNRKEQTGSHPLDGLYQNVKELGDTTQSRYCVGIYIYIYTHTHTHTYIYTYLYVYSNVHDWMACIRIPRSWVIPLRAGIVWVCIYIYIHTHICIYIFVYTFECV